MKADLVKYLIIGFLLGISLMFFMGGNTDNRSGRYELHTVKDYSSGKVLLEYFYILDTETGVAKRFMARTNAIASFKK